MTLLLARSDLEAGSPGLGRLQALYDGEILFADRALAQLSEAFAIDKGDLVIISSDHGEEFREHGQLGHRLNLFETSTHIPMIWRWPDQWSPHRVTTPTSILDIPSTIAAITDSTHNGHGRPLLTLLRGEQGAKPVPIFSELIAERLPQRAVRLGSIKWIDGALYDLNTDPKETTDLAATRSQEAAQLAEIMKRQLIDHPPVGPQWLTPTHTEATLKQLEAMGYIEHD
jgi:arylsulfatase A-like enzyme